MTLVSPYGLSDEVIRNSLDAVAAEDAAIRQALARAGYPPERRRPHDFVTLLRVIVGQQVSVKAANAIYARVAQALGGAPTPAAVLSLGEDALRAVGLSRQKAVYAAALAEAVESGALSIADLPDLDDEAAIAMITAVKGLGRWSAQMYLISSLGRRDVWPVDDIAVQEGVRLITGLAARPKPKVLEDIGQRWRPHRSAVALLAWHYYGVIAL